MLLAPKPLPTTTSIVSITRSGKPASGAQISLAQFKRKLADLAAYLFRKVSFPAGALLMTGTSIVPPDDFTSHSGVTISITHSRRWDADD